MPENHNDGQLSVSDNDNSSKKSVVKRKINLMKEPDENVQNNNFQNNYNQINHSKSNDDELTLGDQTHTTNMSRIPYDLSINSYAGGRDRNIGKLCWYYSDAKVCERCYSVYRDIDARRSKHQNKISSSSLSPKGKESFEKDKEIEERINSQKQFASRMSTMQLKKEKKSIISDRYSSNPQSSIGSTSSYFQRGDKGNNSIEGFSVNDFEVKKSPKKGIVALSPKGFLPPLGQLRAGEKVQKYQQVSSAFIRNIGAKVRDMSSQRILDAVSSMGTGTGMSEGRDDVSSEWEQVTRGGSSGNSNYNGNGNGQQNIPVKGLLRGDRGSKSSNSLTGNIEVKEFDASRLLHKHQRELYDMRVAARGSEKNEVDNGQYVKVENTSKIVVLKRDKEHRRASTPAKKLNTQPYTQSMNPVENHSLPPLQYSSQNAHDRRNYLNSSNNQMAPININQSNLTVNSDRIPDKIISNNNHRNSPSTLPESYSRSPTLSRNTGTYTDSSPDRNASTYTDKSPDRKSVSFAELKGPVSTVSPVSKTGGSNQDNEETRSSSTSPTKIGFNVNVSDYLAGLYSRANDDSDGGSGTDEGDEEEGIGWSPFVIPPGH